jgi:phosphotransferase system HPr-like phosphotransfer protein
MHEIKIKVEDDFAPYDLINITKVASESVKCVSLEKVGSYSVDAKSILGLFTLSLQKGDTIIVRSEDDYILDKLNEIL